MNRVLQPKIVVVGSLNIDYTFLVDSLPNRGETTRGYDRSLYYGGKGANQAIAATRAGGQVSLIGMIGDDAEGNAYKKRLEREGIDTQYIFSTNKEPTGSAYVFVEDSGENEIVVYGGANEELLPGHIDQASRLIKEADVLVCQLEVPVNTVHHAVNLAQKSGTQVVLNPSPWSRDIAEFPLNHVVVNQAEADNLGNLSHQPIDYLVVTRGSQSTICFASEVFETPTLPVVPVDTVGAGDTFTGFYAVEVARQKPSQSVIQLANRAGALATLRKGAQEAIPTREEVLNHE